MSKLEQRVAEIFSASDALSIQMITAFARAELLKAAEIADTYGSEVAKRVIGKPIADEIRRLAE